VGDVRTLSVVPIDRSAGGSPQPRVIEFLEKLVARARTGELQSVAVGYVAASGHPCEGYSRGDRPEDTFLLPTAVLCVLHRMTQDLNSNDLVEPVPPPTPVETQ
jgi:hypothetical protein